MRKILFRGKPKAGYNYGKDWLYGSLLQIDDSNYGIIELSDVSCDENGYVDYSHTPVQLESISQFTGSYDQKEKDCFHKDIVQYGQNIGIVEWDDTAHSWCIYIPKRDVHSQLIDGEYEIIGNIHDNPELLT